MLMTSPVTALEAKDGSFFICYYVCDGETQTHDGLGLAPLEPHGIQARPFLCQGQRGEVTNLLV